ncbi:MAG: cation:proton antiporter [Oscillospiraceae bacterium]|nr:cation:proton antiporter [Oscillospiraceae bacterium]
MTDVLIVISDLALLLVVAGLSTLLFRRIKMPVVLGYIMAGFLIGDVISFIPNLGNEENIHLWSELGVIFLMFGLGLEFSIHKMKEVGAAGTVSCITEVVGLLLVGFVIGTLLGFNTINSIFLGGMMSTCSTMLTMKSIDDAGRRKERFAEVTLGTMVVNDIVAIFMMMILSMIAASKGVSGIDLLANIGKLFFYLTVWLLLGIYIIPSVLKKTMHLMNDETLLIISLGSCFAMSWLADALGFSTALGAFLAGSILAGTVHAERIERLVTPCKDLFGAVFFVSVGMMVDPALLANYIVPVLIITISTIIGKLIFTTLGMRLAGETCKTSLNAAAAQIPIGEFAFIIASLGVSLGVTADFLYPVIVAVSVVTTVVSPFLLKASDRLATPLSRIMPDKSAKRKAARSEKKSFMDPDWSAFLRHFFLSYFLYSLVLLGLVLLGVHSLRPLLEQYLSRENARLVTLIVIYLISIPLLPGIVTFRKRYFTTLWLKNFANRVPLTALLILRFLTAAYLIILPILLLYRIRHIWLLLLVIPAVYFASNSNKLAGLSMQLQARFLSNFNERVLNEKYVKTGGETSHVWLDERMHTALFICQPDSLIIGRSLEELDWARTLNTKVICIIRSGKRINIPQSTERIHADDKLIVMADTPGLDSFRLGIKESGLEQEGEIWTLRRYIEEQDNIDEESQLLCCAVRVGHESGLSGKSLRSSGIKSEWHAFLVGLERHLYPIFDPLPDMPLQEDDLLWVLGDQKMGRYLFQHNLLDG